MPHRGNRVELDERNDPEGLFKDAKPWIAAYEKAMEAWKSEVDRLVITVCEDEFFLLLARYVCMKIEVSVGMWLNYCLSLSNWFRV